jgi:hypothetical protein
MEGETGGEERDDERGESDAEGDGGVGDEGVGLEQNGCDVSCVRCVWRVAPYSSRDVGGSARSRQGVFLSRLDAPTALCTLHCIALHCAMKEG